MILTSFQLSIRVLVKSYYQEPHRFHHTWDHIQAMLDGYQEYFGDTMGEEEYLAILYHDIVYSPWSKRNEVDSIEMMMLHHTQYFSKKNDSVMRAASSIIYDTAHNPELVHAKPSERVMDLDMMILGKSEKAYERYKNNTRREFIRYDDDQWNEGRAKVLEGFLAQKRIFFTQEMFDAFEVRARQNIQKELDECNTYLATYLVAA
jgi:predicted metal-dependent HD superfamily phosphohydrolase